MDLMEAVKGRRSVRKYEQTEIPDNLMEQVLEAVRWSPSWNNTQVWDIILVKDPGMRESIAGLVDRTNPASKAMVDAPVVAVLCGKLRTSGFYGDIPRTKFGDWFMFDLGIAAQTFCLAAHGLGLGTVVVGRFDHEGAGRILELPEGHEVVAFIPVGYPAKTGPAPKRKEIQEFAHLDTFGRHWAV